MGNEFLELYGGLQSHHEEKRQQHFIESAAEMNSKTASSNSISNSITGGNESNTATTTTTSQSNNASNTNETIPPPSDTIVGIEPVEMKITEEEVTFDMINNDLESSCFLFQKIISFDTTYKTCLGCKLPT